MWCEKYFLVLFFASMPHSNCIATLILKQSSNCISTVSPKCYAWRGINNCHSLWITDNTKSHTDVQSQMDLPFVKLPRTPMNHNWYTFSFFYSHFLCSHTVNRQNEPSKINRRRCESHWKTILIEGFICVKSNDNYQYFFCLNDQHS